jgi:hypothetical protein
MCVIDADYIRCECLIMCSLIICVNDADFHNTLIIDLLNCVYVNGNCILISVECCTFKPLSLYMLIP